MQLNAVLTAAIIVTAPMSSMAADTSNIKKEDVQMTTESTEVQKVRQAIDDLIQTATTYDIKTLERIYHDTLHVVMIDNEYNVNTANKEAFKGLFASKRDAGDPPMNTWAKFHSIEVEASKAHVLLSRKNDLSGTNMDLTLSIDLIHEDGRWQVTREVIFLAPEAL